PKREPGILWAEFIQSHEEVLAACDFFTAEVITPAGLITYYVLFFIIVGSRRIHIAGVTPHPGEHWINQVARNVTMDEWGFLSKCRYLIHDRDSKFCGSFQQILKSAGVKPLKLPPKSPNLNAFAERWVRSVKEECLSKLVLFGEDSLSHALEQYVAHYHEERNHQGKGNVILFPGAD
ncbi:MAG: transposase family protein, partial [bacterium]|nr:transposase family protein [bacterium]